MGFKVELNGWITDLDEKGDFTKFKSPLTGLEFEAILNATSFWSLDDEVLSWQLSGHHVEEKMLHMALCAILYCLSSTA